MQERNCEKIVALSIRTAKMTRDVLKQMLTKFIEEQEKKKPVVYHGKQSLKHLLQGNGAVTNIEVTDQNIRSFNRTARKFHIDYSLRKDNSVDPPRYMVFFRARDNDIMTAAFKSFLNSERNRDKKPSVRTRLKSLGEQVQQQAQERTREKTKIREAER